MEFSIEQLPSWFISPFQMPPIRPAVITWRIVPSDTKLSVCCRERPQQGKLQSIAHVAGVLIAHVSPALVPVQPHLTALQLCLPSDFNRGEIRNGGA